MDVLIVEDELLARRTLAAMLGRLGLGINIVGETGSVEDTVAWLSDTSRKADLIFMDVELSDGNCFEIFNRTRVKPYVIMTTAYDSYAIKAFKVESVDYILKPIDPDELRAAVERVQRRIATEGAYPGVLSEKSPRKRFLIKLNDRIVPVRADDIAYFYAEDKGTYIVTSDAHKYVIDFSLDIAMEQVSPDRFFRISRNCIVSMTAISSIVKVGSRYMVSTMPESSFDMMVSRSRTDDFLHWLEGRS